MSGSLSFGFNYLLKTLWPSNHIGLKFPDSKKNVGVTILSVIGQIGVIWLLAKTNLVR